MTINHGPRTRGSKSRIKLRAGGGKKKNNDTAETRTDTVTAAARHCGLYIQSSRFFIYIYIFF